MARPKSQVPTKSKSYMFNDEDIKWLDSTNVPAKIIFSLGVAAYKVGWSPAKESDHIKDLRDDIEFLKLRYEKLGNRMDIFRNVILRITKIDINAQPVTETEKELKKIVKDGKKET